MRWLCERSLSGLTERLDAGLARLRGIDWFGHVG
jgi:hypothetical protein